VVGEEAPFISETWIRFPAQRLLPDREWTVRPCNREGGRDHHSPEVDPAQSGRSEPETQGKADHHEGGPEEMQEHEDVSKYRFHRQWVIGLRVNG